MTYCVRALVPSCTAFRHSRNSTAQLLVSLSLLPFKTQTVSNMEAPLKIKSNDESPEDWQLLTEMLKNCRMQIL